MISADNKEIYDNYKHYATDKPLIEAITGSTNQLNIEDKKSNEESKRLMNSGM